MSKNIMWQSERANERSKEYAHLRNTLSTAVNSMTSSERPSPEPLLKKEVSPAVLTGRQFWKCSGEATNALNYRAWGIPAVLSRGVPGKALRAFPGSFRNFPEFLPESPSRAGGMAQYPNDMLKLHAVLVKILRLSSDDFQLCPMSDGPPLANRTACQKNVRNHNHHHVSKKHHNTPRICIAVCLLFVLQYFRCRYALRKGKHCQYASLLYRNAPPICIAVLLGKSWFPQRGLKMVGSPLQCCFVPRPLSLMMIVQMWARP